MGKVRRTHLPLKHGVNLKALLQPWFVARQRPIPKELDKTTYLALCSQNPAKTDLITMQKVQ